MQENKEKVHMQRRNLFLKKKKTAKEQGIIPLTFATDSRNCHLHQEEQRNV